MLNRDVAKFGIGAGEVVNGRIELLVESGIKVEEVRLGIKVPGVRTGIKAVEVGRVVVENKGGL